MKFSIQILNLIFLPTTTKNIEQTKKNAVINKSNIEEKRLNNDEFDNINIWIENIRQSNVYIVNSLEELYYEFNRDDSYYRLTQCKVIGNKFENDTRIPVQTSKSFKQ